MKYLLPIFIFLTVSLSASRFFDQFEDLKSRDWHAICALGEKDLEDESLTDLEKAQICARLASSYFYLGEYESMKGYIEACRSIALDHSSKKYFIRSLYLLSAYYRGSSLFKEAREVIDEAMELLGSDVEDYLKAKVYFNAGAAYADDPSGDPLKAIEYYQKALTLLDRSSNDAHRVQIRMAKSHLLLKQHKKAWEALLPLFQVDLQPRTSVHLQYICAQIYIAEGDFEAALVEINEALSGAEELSMAADGERLNKLKSQIFDFKLVIK